MHLLANTSTSLFLPFVVLNIYLYIIYIIYIVFYLNTIHLYPLL